MATEQESTQLIEQARMQTRLQPEDAEYLKSTGFDPEIGGLALDHFGKKAIQQITGTNLYKNEQERVLGDLGRLLSISLRVSKKNGIETLGNQQQAWGNINYGNDQLSLAMNAGVISYFVGKGEFSEIINNVKIRESGWGIKPDGTLPAHLEHTGYIPIERLMSEDKKFLAEFRKMLERKKSEPVENVRGRPNIDFGKTISEVDQVASEHGKYVWDQNSGQYVESKK